MSKQEKLIEAQHYLEEMFPGKCVVLSVTDALLPKHCCGGCVYFKNDKQAPCFDGYCTNPEVGVYVEGERELLALDVDEGFYCSKYKSKA